MDHRFFLNSPSLSPFKTEPPSSSFSTHIVGNKMTPIKKEPMSFSPFKTSGLSPFKLINQSPSKGSYDDWDNDFIASFEETLFGMDDGMAASNLLDEMLKSPAGKAMLESRSSPLRMRNASAVRRLKISPANKNTSGSFQSLFQSNEGLVVGEVDISAIKEEDGQEGYLHGQTHFANTLCPIDPNKMSDTPIKPGLSHSSENAPKRKLAMKMPEQDQSFQTYVIQDNPMSGIQQIRHEWPSKERLKYARLRFQKVLNSAVEREIEIVREQRNRNNSTKGMQNAQKENKKKGHSLPKAKTVKGGKAKASKPKGKGKKSRHDKYPQIKMALSKPSVPKKGSGAGKAMQISKKLFQSSSRDNMNLGWYPDCDEEDDDEEDEWTAPVPFKTARNNSYFEMEEGDSSDEDLDNYIFETQSGRQVTWKKRRLY